MVVNKVRIGRLSFRVPGDWQSIRKADAKAACRVLYSSNANYPVSSLFYAMSGIRRRPLFCVWWQLAVGQDDREFVALKITSFIGRKVLPDKDGKHLFIAPERLLFIQFIRIHELMEGRQASEDGLRLTCARMLSVYFLPEGASTYNDAHATAQEELFMHLDSAFIFKYAEHVSNEFVRICNQFPRIFKGEPGETGGTGTTDAASQWMDVARNQAGSPLYIEQILQLPAEVVLFDLQGRIEDYQKIKNQIKHDRNQPDRSVL